MKKNIKNKLVIFAVSLLFIFPFVFIAAFMGSKFIIPRQTTSRLKKRISVQDSGESKIKIANILKYSNVFNLLFNKDIGPRNFEMICNRKKLFWSGYLLVPSEITDKVLINVKVKHTPITGWILDRNALGGISAIRRWILCGEL